MEKDKTFDEDCLECSIKNKIKTSTSTATPPVTTTTIIGFEVDKCTKCLPYRD